MATNVVFLNVYQINAYDPIPTINVQKYGFSTTGNLIRSIPSNLALLSTGIYVYSAIQVPNGTQYYVVENQAQITTAFNA